MIPRQLGRAFGALRGENAIFVAFETALRDPAHGCVIVDQEDRLLAADHLGGRLGASSRRRSSNPAMPA